MLSDSHRLAFVQDDNVVCMEDGADSLRNNHNGSILCFRDQCFSQRRICFEIESRKAIVKNIKFRLLHQGTGDGKTLFLSSRKVRAALRHKGFQFIRQCLNKILCLCNGQGVPELIVCCFRISVSQVFRNGS